MQIAVQAFAWLLSYEVVGTSELKLLKIIYCKVVNLSQIIFMENLPVELLKIIPCKVVKLSQIIFMDNLLVEDKFNTTWWK